MIWKNTFHNFGKYISRFEQIQTHFNDILPEPDSWTLSVDVTIVILINIFYNLNKYILQFEQIHFTIWGNIFQNLNKYILQFEEINFKIWTNTDTFQWMFAWWLDLASGRNFYWGCLPEMKTLFSMDNGEALICICTVFIS